MSTTSATERARVAALVAALVAAVGSQASAQPLYRYRDTNGGVVFSDREPQPGEPFDLLDVTRAEAPGFVRVYQRGAADGVRVLAAENAFHGTVQIAFRVVAATNVTAGAPQRGNLILPPRSATPLFEFRPLDPALPSPIEFEYEFVHGHPGARHRPAMPYRLPYAVASRYRVSQAYPDTVTHVDPANADAIDFEMPIGTQVFAAREGVVIDVVSDYFEAGIDDRFATRANMVRILHDDGTMALYAHLNWNSIRVASGTRVQRGEYIADSGNTGFSSGPHLHFVVQRNNGGQIVSVPVEFAGPAAAAVTLATGDRPVAR